MPWLTAAEKLASGPSAVMARGQFAHSVIWKTYSGKVVRCVYYVPSNPQTSVQQSWRGVFASAVSSWQGLSPEEKASWNRIQARVRCYRHKSGYNVYLSYYLRGLPLDPVPWWEVNGP